MYEVEISCNTGFVTVKVESLLDATETILDVGKRDKDNSLAYTIKPISDTNFKPLNIRNL